MTHQICQWVRTTDDKKSKQLNTVALGLLNLNSTMLQRFMLRIEKFSGYLNRIKTHAVFLCQPLSKRFDTLVIHGISLHGPNLSLASFEEPHVWLNVIEPPSRVYRSVPAKK